MDDKQKIVDFEYCKQCEYWSRSESSDPCWYCLNSPTNTDSHRPVYFKERATNKKSKK